MITADHMIENVVGVHALPLGFAWNFEINGKGTVVPMALEEPSVVASASFMAKLARAGGGFTTYSTDPVMIGQMQVLDIEDPVAAAKAITDNKDLITEHLAGLDPMLEKLGGGLRDVEARVIHESPIGPFLVVHLHVDVRDAMGANAVNTACEFASPLVSEITGGRVHLRILSNLADQRITTAKCRVPLDVLGTSEFRAEDVRDGIIEAWAFAAADPYRAATHNKGIMNGVDPVVIATGNDWRAVEAGAHCYAARSGRYTSLTTWSKCPEDGALLGEIELPLAVGTVGGATGVHPAAVTALKVLNVESAPQLAEVMAAVGLAQNMAALRALSTEGIQRGHMRLHARQVAMSVGAVNGEVSIVAARLAQEGKVLADKAVEILADVRAANARHAAIDLSLES
jgi:hydroxymethylglutaryl-CoA reductase